MGTRCERCHNYAKELILVELIDYNRINNCNITSAKICPKCSHILRDWLWQGEDLGNEVIND